MSPFSTFNRPPSMARRAFLQQSAYGLGGMALAGLLEQATASPSDRWRGALTKPHAPVRARRVIHLCMAGGPSHLETFDWKPVLKDLDGKAFPES
ncbi:MAG: DUF1501 domain-containing protein, partial [Verrucomicrobium sp.]